MKRKELKEKYDPIVIQKCCELLGFTTLEDALANGVSIKELDDQGKEVNKLVWGKDYKPLAGRSTPVRSYVENKITEIYGSKENYYSRDIVRSRRIKKIGDSMESKYGEGIRNAGQLPAHREAMKKGSNCRNPFSSSNFNVRAYIRGVSCLSEDKEKFEKYKIEVKRLTDISKKKLEFTGIDYYTGDIIYRYDGNKNVNRNDWNMATVDHKIPILRCFYEGLTPEQAADVNNLCWTSKYFNGFKLTMTEEELRASGIIERYKEVKEKLYGNQWDKA